MKMKCIVIDDEPLAIEGVLMNIGKVDFLEVDKTFTDPIEAMNYMENNLPDLLFVDIEMPDMTGLELLNSLRKKPLTIITTAYPQYALEGYELGVTDYLVKPIAFPRFVKAVNKAKEIMELEEKASYELDKTEQDYVFIRHDRKFVKLHFNDIKYVKGLKDYVVIHTDNEKLITAVNLRNFAAQIPSDKFARINKSYIVNVDHIDAVYNEGVYIGEEQFTLGQTYRDEFQKKHIDGSVIKRQPSK